MQLSLPSHLEFNIVNLRRVAQDHQETVFMYLHLILNSLIAMSHSPSIFRSYPTPPRMPDIVTAVSEALGLSQHCLMRFTCLVCPDDP